jgi:hypothetical protein
MVTETQMILVDIAAIAIRDGVPAHRPASTKDSGAWCPEIAAME